MDELRAGRLAALGRHTSWPELEAWVDEYRAAYAEYLSKTILVTGVVPDDLEYKRGFLAGMRYVTRYPGAAVKQLDKAIAKSKEAEVVVSGPV